MSAGVSRTCAISDYYSGGAYGYEQLTWLQNLIELPVHDDKPSFLQSSLAELRNMKRLLLYRKYFHEHVYENALGLVPVRRQCIMQ